MGVGDRDPQIACGSQRPQVGPHVTGNSSLMNVAPFPITKSSAHSVAAILSARLEGNTISRSTRVASRRVNKQTRKTRVASQQSTLRLNRTSASCWPVLQSTTSPVPAPVSATTRPLGTLLVGRAGPPKPLPTTPLEGPAVPFFFFFFELRFLEFLEPFFAEETFWGSRGWGVLWSRRTHVGSFVRFRVVFLAWGYNGWVL